MNGAVIVDTSIVIKWVLYEPDSPLAQALLREWINREIEIRAPALLAYEITNSLYQKVRKGEITHKQADNALTKALKSDLVLDFSRGTVLSLKAMQFADRFQLPAAYDAYFLALAEQRGCELWTADTRMWRVVKGQLAWVHTLESYSPPSS
ncbi:MAG TPA: type II toxin-antitoxin system VapC family toxin [Ktedonobacteraceae bacterium]